FAPHLPGLRYKLLSKALGATMWFFIFYRARFVESVFMLVYGIMLRHCFDCSEDGSKLLVPHLHTLTDPPLTVVRFSLDSARN
ncbi:hypothetical protein JB92DRAFT_2687744, partial [Gautieria morchelliformis]